MSQDPFPVSKVPLAIDLDGSLINSDMLFESLVSALKNNFWLVFLLPWWLLQGRAYLKQELGKRAAVDVTALPYNRALLSWITNEKRSGRPIVLCTASNEAWANKISEHLAVFDQVIASDGRDNLVAERKERRLVELFGTRGFDYAGNAHQDLKVWRSARRAVLVNVSERTRRNAAKIAQVDKDFPAGHVSLVTIFRMLRVHQWVKNVLVFVPILAAHRVTIDNAGVTFVAFLSFSLCASAVYILNDLVDLNSDRHHEKKKQRPFASGELGIPFGLVLAPMLLASSLFVGFFAGEQFLLVLCCYFLLTTTYSFYFKSLVLIDCFCLAALYTLRILAGAEAVAIDLTFWLFGFSLFTFLSLAFVKRHAELLVAKKALDNVIRGRGYYASDAGLIQSFGVSAGVISALVLALYINSPRVSELYLTPEILWLNVPLMMLWICRVWMASHREEMHHDPIVFAMRDRASLIIGAAFVIVFFCASILSI
jgi:4-hydroxybenzoate polyprenyltransferase